jgi:uncharacterized membrane protein
VGLLIIVPVGVTVFILEWAFRLVDNILQPLINVLHGENITGLGVAATLLLVFIIGTIASNVFGKRMINWLESPFRKIPVLRTIYVGTRQLLEGFSSTKKSFRQVVLVEYPRKGIRSIGFVTNISKNEAGEKTYSVLVPTAPNPASGFLIIVKEDEIIPTSISMDDAVSMIVSAGSYTHKDMERLERKDSESRK